jgi:hypothetical protein
MAVLTDNLQQLLCLPDEVILYSFCDWQDAKTHSPLLILGSLTRQLAESCTSTSDAVLDAFNDNRQGQAKLSLEDLFNLFAQLSFGFRKIFIVLDALDECDGGARGMETVNSPVVEHLLCRILDLGSHISVAISSRFAPSIRVPSGVFQTVHVKALPNDLELFANRELASMKAATRWTNPRLQKAVQEDRKLRGEVAQKCATSAGDM